MCLPSDFCKSSVSAAVSLSSVLAYLVLGSKINKVLSFTVTTLIHLSKTKVFVLLKTVAHSVHGS